jgi:hypothetical protein
MLQDHRYLEPPILGVKTVCVDDVVNWISDCCLGTVGDDMTDVWKVNEYLTGFDVESYGLRFLESSSWTLREVENT